MIPPLLCWPQAGRWFGLIVDARTPATYFAVGEITEVGG